MTFGVVTNPRKRVCSLYKCWARVRFIFSRHSPVANVGSGFGLTKMIHSPAGGWLRGGVRVIELKGPAPTKIFFFGFYGFIFS